MKLNKIDEVWNSVNPLFKWRFGLLSSKNFATMATWRNDFSSLFSDQFNRSQHDLLQFNPLRPESDQHQLSPNNMHTSSRQNVMRINKMITGEKNDKHILKR